MARIVTYGRHADTKPNGMYREIIFPKLADLDNGTKEGWRSRILSSDGADTRSLPRTVFAQFVQAGGHDGSVAVGMIDEVTVDGENSNFSGKGWLVDSDEGRKAALYVITQTLRHNSIDIAEADVEFEEHGDWWDDDYSVDIIFKQWKLGGTTLVGIPAFADAHAVIPDELVAALADDSPLVIEVPYVINFAVEPDESEIVASAAGTLPPWDAFHRPEPAEPHAIRVGDPDENGWIPVYGHLSKWNTCHDGIEGRCVMTPRPTDNYASFNRLEVLTDRGRVETGPISLKGGHQTLAKALDDVDNAWADVRIIAGVHGPWMSGVVRPGVTEEQLYAARASAVSGHWKGGRLRAVVSVNAEGFNIPGSGFSFSFGNGHVNELVASFPSCEKPEPTGPQSSNFTIGATNKVTIGDVTFDAASLEHFIKRMQMGTSTFTPPLVESTAEVDDEAVADDLDDADLALALELDAEA